MPAELLDYGLLGGLRAQSEIPELLDEIYHEGSYQTLKRHTGDLSARGLRRGETA
jgi:hypothetical protein